MHTPILQFGTSRFLQAHALSFFQSGRATKAPPLVTVVQSTADPARRARLAGLAAPEGYRVLVRGLNRGAPIEREERVQVVRRALSYDADLVEIERIAVFEANWIVSNTTERGFEPLPADRLPGPHPAQSYPAKLYHLLALRHLAGAPRAVILPTELLTRNGDRLKARVLQIAVQQKAAPSLIGGLHQQIWANSLVDRIVSAQLFPAGAVAEPYGLWAVERQPGLEMPVSHPAIQLVDRLDPYEKLKLHILNVGHTVLVDLWQRAGQGLEFVREAMESPLRAPLLDILHSEVLPGFARRGMGDEAADYLSVTLSRFENPFLDHRLGDIAQNHSAKIINRINAFLDWSGASPELAPRLWAISKGAAA